MIPQFLNNIFRRRSAKYNGLACLVCPHVLEDPIVTKFLCRTGEGYAASCDISCLEVEDEDRLGMIHLGHVLSIGRTLLDIGGLPVNIALNRSGKTWVPSYFSDQYFPEKYVPVEGDFIAPPDGDSLLELNDDEEFFVFSLGKNRIVTVGLDDGFQIIPVWEKSEKSIEFQNHLIGKEILIKLPLKQIRMWAKKNQVWFLGHNFLMTPVDHALIA